MDGMFVLWEGARLTELETLADLRAGDVLVIGANGKEKREWGK